MKVHLHIRGKTIVVECGAATQRIRWLANVGVARYDDSFGRSLGTPMGVQKEGGVACDMQHRIVDELENGQHAFVILDDHAE
jgi:hypothetical protein